MKATFQHRVMVTLTPKQYEEIAKRARSRGEALSVIIREVVTEGLGKLPVRKAG